MNHSQRLGLWTTLCGRRRPFSSSKASRRHSPASSTTTTARPSSTCTSSNSQQLVFPRASSWPCGDCPCFFDKRTFSSSSHHNNKETLSLEEAEARLKYSGLLSSSSTGSTSSTTPNVVQDIFKVTEVNFQGELRTVYMTPSEILQHTTILPRDLVSLHLTSWQEEQEQQNYHPKDQTKTRTEQNSTSTTTDKNDDDNKEPTHHHRRGGRHALRSPTLIMPRTHCILVSFGNVRAVATRDAIFVLDSHTPIAKSFAKDLAAVYTTTRTTSIFSSSSSSSLSATTREDNNNEGDEVPELVFLETVLKDTIDTFTRRVRLFDPIVESFLSRVSNEVFSDQGVHLLAPLKDSLSSLEIQVSQCLECLTQLLNDDDQMLKLLLTEQALARQLGQKVDFERHQHVELLLTVYSRQVYNLSKEIHYLLGRIQSKQEFVALALAGYRNRLVRMNVHIGIGGVATGLTTAMTGLFGMNLISGLEDSPTAFWTVAGGSTVVAMSVVAGAMYVLRGRAMQERAKERLEEMETLSSALSDMGALDYTIKKMIQYRHPMTKEDFKTKLMRARHSQTASDEEVDFLFRVLDTQKDNQLAPDDFMKLHHHGHHGRHYNNHHQKQEQEQQQLEQDFQQVEQKQSPRSKSQEEEK